MASEEVLYALLAAAEAQGLAVAAVGDRLVVRGPKSAEHLAKLLEHKQDLLPVLREIEAEKAKAEEFDTTSAAVILDACESVSSEVRAPSAPIPPFDQAEADRILCTLSADLARIEREQYRGKFPPVVARVATICLECIEANIKNHELEAARGWDPMKLVRDAAASTLKTVRGDYTMAVHKDL